MPISDFIERIYRYFNCSGECYVLSLIYIDRLIKMESFVINEYSAHRIVLISLMLAAKFFDDVYYTNTFYAEVGGIQVEEINKLELEYLYNIRFCLFVSPQEYQRYYSDLVEHCASLSCQCMYIQLPLLMNATPFEETPLLCIKKMKPANYLSSNNSFYPLSPDSSNASTSGYSDIYSAFASISSAAYPYASNSQSYLYSSAMEEAISPTNLLSQETYSSNATAIQRLSHSTQHVCTGYSALPYASKDHAAEIIYDQSYSNTMYIANPASIPKSYRPVNGNEKPRLYNKAGSNAKTRHVSIKRNNRGYDEFPVSPSLNTQYSTPLYMMSNFVNPSLTDLYQITMTYSYWKLNRHNELATFDIFFRQNPFQGEFTIFGGLDNALALLKNFRFLPEHIAYLKEQMPSCEPEFFEYLSQVDASSLTVYSMKEGCMVFPSEPVVRVTGPIAVCQLLETPLLCMVNFASLVATNAARHRIAVGDHIGLSEFGLRRAQGPDGGMTASKYSYMGGFNSTSNVEAGMMYHIPIGGTHAHSYVLSYNGLEDIKDSVLNGVDLKKEALKIKEENDWSEAREGEMAAFIAYALSFPKGCLCLIDSFDVLKSGLPNFICVAVALYKAGYTAIGIRVDSGDLAYLSRMVRKEFIRMEEKYCIPFSRMTIVASNDINVDVLYALNKQNHEINSFGIGTNLVTCQGQPALGMVYKLADLNGKPRMKLTEDSAKMTIPGKKKVYRLYGHEGHPMVDLVMLDTEEAPKENEKVLCYHIQNSKKRCYCTPSRVEELLVRVWDKEDGIVYTVPSLKDSRDYVLKQLKEAREDHIRYLNPTPYKVSSSVILSEFVTSYWESVRPIAELF